MSIIKLYLDYDFFKSDPDFYITVNWNTETYPHSLCIGITGSGKTVATKYALVRILQDMPYAKIYICDYKNDDYKQFEGCNNYYSFLSCIDGIDVFFQMFQQRQNGKDLSRTFRLLMIDEYASLLNNVDKKTAEKIKSQIATILMLGRSFGCHLWITQQRPDAEYFAKARDNFSFIIAMGNISKESVQMLGFDKENMIPCNRGEGYVLFGSFRQEHIIVPKIRDFRAIDEIIKKGLF